MKVFSVRFEDAQVEALEAISRRDGKTLSDIIREFVDRCLKAAPQPTPSTPPPPTAPPPPTDQPGQGGAAGAELPSVLASRLAELARDLTRLRYYRAFVGLQYWLPKALAFLAAAAPFSAPDSQTVSNELSFALFFILVEALWPARAVRRAVLARAARDLEQLIQDVPRLWADASRAKSPDAAAADVLAQVDERRARMGGLGLKDLSLAFWDPA